MKQSKKLLFKPSRWNDKEGEDGLRRNASVDELMHQQPDYRGAPPVTSFTAQGNFIHFNLWPCTVCRFCLNFKTEILLWGNMVCHWVCHSRIEVKRVQFWGKCDHFMCVVLPCFELWGTINVPVLVNVSHATVFMFVSVHYLHTALSTGSVNIVSLPLWVDCGLHVYFCMRILTSFGAACMLL